ncbi:ATP-binding cassette domain-containing protein, partial [Streptococcus pyogenes]
PLLQARGLSKVYRMGDVQVAALRNVDLDVYDGEFLVILGPSGSGKSTLLNLLGGMDRLTSGTLRFRTDLELSTASDAVLTRYRRHNV